MRAVVFDLYGTLIYIAKETKPYRRFFRDVGFSDEKVQWAREIALTGDFPTFKSYVHKIEPGFTGDLSSYVREIQEEEASVQMYPETENVLRELQARSIKIGVISNLGSLHIPPFFRLGLDQYVSHYIFSCKTGIQKPKKEVFEKMRSLLATPLSQMMMVGDTYCDDIVGAKSAGMNALLIDRQGKNSGVAATAISSLHEVLSYL